MSHNKITVDGQSPDSNGSIDLNMSSYITESSPVENQVIKYNGSEFVNGSSPSVIAPILKLGLHFNSTGWGGGSYYYSVGKYFTVRDAQSINYADTGFNFNDATTTNSILTNNKWFPSVDIPTAGTYLFIRTVALTSGTSMTLRNSNNAGEFGVQVQVNSSNTQGAAVWGIANCVENDIFRTVVKSISGTVKNIDDEEMRTLSLLIFKLS
jgi:hypothetical protein